MIIGLTTGDKAGAGYNRTRNYLYDVNCTYIELKQAYEQGVNICGVDLTKDIACEYEDSSMSIGDIRSLLHYGIISKTYYTIT